MQRQVIWATDNREWIYVEDIREAVQRIIRYVEDTAGSKAIYLDGWKGLCASAVLRAIAEEPPPSLCEKFNKIIHIDCSRWKSRRALQREIALQIKLPPDVMAIFDRQDEEDDFTGVHEGSRNEIKDVGAKIHGALLQDKCLVIFHNGSNDTINLIDFGIPQPIGQWYASGNKLLWTFRGRLRLNSEISAKVDNSHLYLYLDDYEETNWNYLLQNEAREIARYTDKQLGEEVAQECCLYLLALNSRGGNTVNYNWTIHASNYWVCDGIVQGGHDDEAWEVGAALQQQIHTEDYSSNTLPPFGRALVTPKGRWKFFSYNSAVVDNRDIDKMTVHSETTSFFLAVPSGSNPPLPTLPNGMFHQSDNLRVLKLCRCTFSFSSPPFRCCRSLRFLGLDDCKDKPQEQDENEERRPALEIFRSLWVLDICYTDWELALSPEIIDQMAANIREVHIKKGRFWCRNFKWRQLQNLRKLRVIEPTCPWKTGEMDEFTEMVKLELLDLSGNSTIQVLPSLSGATSLKTIVLHGCVGLEHVGPQGLPPSLESFSLHAEAGEDNISLISLVGSPRLMDFRLSGSLPKLEELDLSGTSVKTLDLNDEVVEIPCLQRVMLFGCEQLRAVLWPEYGMRQLRMLCIDTRGVEVGRRRILPPDSSKLIKDYCQAYVGIMDMRFLQSLVLRNLQEFCWNTERCNLNLCISATSTDDGQSLKKRTGPPPLPKSLIPRSYIDVTMDKIKTIDHGYVDSAVQFQPSSCHVEIGEGISNTSVESVQGVEAVILVMDQAMSLHVHDNFSITTVIPERMMSTEDLQLTWKHPLNREKMKLPFNREKKEERILSWEHLKWCRVERCPKLHTVFTPDYRICCFEELETIWAAHLSMALCIWSKGKTVNIENDDSFANLRSIHLYSCPRLKFVLPLSWFYTLSSLETLHIVNCGDLEQVFPVEEVFRIQIATGYRKGVLEFPSLKHIYLYQLSKLQHICEAKMFAPKLETIRLRGCWGLRRLPAVGRHTPRPIVDCHSSYWEKLEWDGLEVGHHPSLFDTRHSSYYKKPLPRVSVLR